MSEVVVPAIESKAERKARKEQRKAEKEVAKATAAEADSEERESHSSKRKRDDDGLKETAGDVSEEASKKVKKDRKEKKEKSEKTEKKDRKEKKHKKMEATTKENDVLEAAVVPTPQPATVLVSEPSVATGESSDLPETPMADSTLSDQAQKALQYVYLHKQYHITKPAVQPTPGHGWKFNKARQNWCIRNFWNPAEVTEKYLELVLGYLETTVGAARHNIIKQAKEYREKPMPTAEAEGGATLEDAEAGAEQTGAEVETKETEESTAEPVGTEEEDCDATLISEHKRRAEVLLEKMSS